MKQQRDLPAAQQYEGVLTTQGAAENPGLVDLQQRVAQLKALLCCFAEILKNHASSVPLASITHYSQLLQEYTAAVLLYQGTAQHWPQPERQRTRALLEEAITAQRRLGQLLAQHIAQRKKLASKRILKRASPGYGLRDTARLIDLQG